MATGRSKGTRRRETPTKRSRRSTARAASAERQVAALLLDEERQRLLQKLERRGGLIAHHEAGHVLASMVWTDAPDHVTVAPANGLDGYARWLNHVDDEVFGTLPIGDRRRVLDGRIRVHLAGYAAEEVVTSKRPSDVVDWFDDPFVLYWDDGEHDLTRALQADWVAHRRSRASTAGLGDAASMTRLSGHLDVVLDFLRGHRPVLDELARALEARRTLTKDHIFDLVGDRLDVYRHAAHRASIKRGRR